MRTELPSDSTQAWTTASAEFCVADSWARRVCSSRSRSTVGGRKLVGAFGRLGRSPSGAPRTVAEFQSALRAQLPACSTGSGPVRWHHAGAQRSRSAGAVVDCRRIATSHPCGWDNALRLGMCGESQAGAGVQRASHSGHELADHMAMSSEQVAFVAAVAVEAPQTQLAPPTLLNRPLVSPPVAATCLPFSQRLPAVRIDTNSSQGAGPQLLHHFSFSNP
jgi:hypothetical protein